MAFQPLRQENTTPLKAPSLHGAAVHQEHRTGACKVVPRGSPQCRNPPKTKPRRQRARGADSALRPRLWASCRQINARGHGDGLGFEPGAEPRGWRGGTSLRGRARTDSTCVTVPIKAAQHPSAVRGECKSHMPIPPPRCPKSAGQIGQDGASPIRAAYKGCLAISSC